MSAYVLPKVHIDALLTAALQWGTQHNPGGFGYRRPRTTLMQYLTRDNADDVGRMLWEANWQATEGTDGRWLGDERDTADMPPYTFEELPGDADPLVVLKAVSCYDYQTGGDPEQFEDSEAYGS